MDFTEEELANEEWRDIKGFEGYYQVSDLGRIKSLERFAKVCGGGRRLVKERIRKLVVGSGGYYEVNLNKDGATNIRSVHQLVAIEFLNHKPNKGVLEIDHIDENKLNNRVQNLQELTVRQHKAKTFTHKKSTSKYTGVRKSASYSDKFTSTIGYMGGNIYLGTFDTEEEAYEYYKNALVCINEGRVDDIVKADKCASSKYNRVHFNSSKRKYETSIVVNGNKVYLGSFDSDVKANDFRLLALSNSNLYNGNKKDFRDKINDILYKRCG